MEKILQSSCPESWTKEQNITSVLCYIHEQPAHGCVSGFDDEGYKTARFSFDCGCYRTVRITYKGREVRL